MQDVSSKKSSPQPARGNPLADATAPPRRTPLLWVVLVASLVATAFVLQAQRVKPGPPVDWETDFVAAQTVSRATSQPVMLNFTADWCGSCRMLDEGVLRAPLIRSQIEQRFIPVKMDVSDASSPHYETAEAMQISVLPTIVVLNAQGREAGRLTGAVRPEAFVAFMDRMSEACAPRPGKH